MQSIGLKTLQQAEKPVDVILVGLGFMSMGFLSMLKTVPHIRVVVLVSRRPEAAQKKLEKHAIASAITKDVDQIKKNILAGIISITEEVDIISQVNNSIVLDMTGSVGYSTTVALKTLEADKHLITMNPELQVTVGSQLKKKFDEKKLLITDVLGDQPGCLTRLVSQARLKGFKVRMAGNMKKFLNTYATLEEMQPWADDKGFNVVQTVSFTDGTKQSVEMTLVANHFGMDILQPEMKGPTLENIHDVLTYFDWDAIPENGVVDYTLHLNNFPGVFIVVEHPDPLQQQYLRHLNLGDGPRYVLFEPVHLCHLEVVETIVKVAFFGEATITNGVSPRMQTVAVAKKDLSQGDVLGGIGSDEVFGIIDEIHHDGIQLPIGISQGAVVTSEVKKDQVILLSDVIVKQTDATRLLDVE